MNFSLSISTVLRLQICATMLYLGRCGDWIQGFMPARQALHQLSDPPSPPCLSTYNLQRNLPVGGNKCPTTRTLYICSVFHECVWRIQHFLLLATVALARDTIIRMPSIGECPTISWWHQEVPEFWRLCQWRPQAWSEGVSSNTQLMSLPYTGGTGPCLHSCEGPGNVQKKPCFSAKCPLWPTLWLLESSPVPCI